MIDATALVYLEQCEVPVGSKVLQFVRLVAINPVDGREFAAELGVQTGVEVLPHEKQEACRQNADNKRQHAGVPKRKPRAHAQWCNSHSCASPRTNPTPRTVCSSFLS